LVEARVTSSSDYDLWADIVAERRPAPWPEASATEFDASRGPAAAGRTLPMATIGLEGSWGR
ncbi:MAG: hypothetical protein ACOC9N_01375, partial [Gemmatimonadota bacterium]